MSFADQFFGTRNDVRTLVVAPYPRKDETRDRLDEFVNLCAAADLDPIGVTVAPVREPHPGTYFRTGNIETIAEDAQSLAADLVAVDVDLTPVQQRQLEKELECGVLDRSAVILTIFGRRAQSNAGKLQVELAQNLYLLPRLTGLWQHFDREKGGIGLRGAGEKQIEIDRRLLEQRITRIKKDMVKVERTRNLHRSRRRRTQVFHVAVVGYTNVGKSSLMRRITERSVFVRDMPFATLDPLTRRIELSDRTAFLLTDTVGFVQDLPHSLVAAFRSTLEEAAEADALLHMIDISSPDARTQIETTDKVLQEIGAGDRPVLYVLNKADLVRDDSLNAAMVQTLQPNMTTSMVSGQGIDGVLDWIRYHVRKVERAVRIRLPLDRPDLIEHAEKSALRPGIWSSETVEYDVPDNDVLAEDWAC